MPTRVTRSFSRRGLFGGRVRTTVSQTQGQSNIVHWTGKDLLAMQQAQAQAQAEARQRMLDEHAQRCAVAFDTLAPPATWLYLRPVALIGLVLTALASVAALAGISFGVLVAVLLAAGPLALDGWNLRTWHGRINWPLFRSEHPQGAVWAIIGLLVVFYVPTCAYYWHAFQAAPRVKLAQTERLQAEIARLEASVHPAVTETRTE